MWREASDAVLDMLQACDEVLDFASGIDAGKIGNDLLRLRAIERSLAILGEAAKRVPDDIRDRHPDVPWRSASGLRDVLVHDYFGIDVDILAQVIAEELPAMRAKLAALILAEGWTRSAPR